MTSCETNQHQNHDTSLFTSHENEQVKSCETHQHQNHDTSLFISHENKQKDEVVVCTNVKNFFSTQLNHRFLKQTSHTQQMWK
jgi:seryl-tRNA synthetase